MKLILIGGGSISNRLSIHKYMFDCCKIPKPRLLFVPLSNNTKDFIDCFKEENCFVTIYEKIEDLRNADIIYIGGGNTEKFIKEYKENGFIDELLKLMNKKVIVGVSAGAIFWFKKYYSDIYAFNDGMETRNYRLVDGIGYFDAYCCPHYNQSGKENFNEYGKEYLSIAIDDDCALALNDEEIDIIRENKEHTVYYFYQGILNVLTEKNKKQFYELLREGKKKIS